MPKAKITSEIQAHRDRVGQLRCMISGRPNPTLHHCKAGSMLPIIGLKGGALKTSEWLIIPLDVEFHTGGRGIDGGMGVYTWEINFGTQVSHLDVLCMQLGYNVWKRAGFDRRVHVKREGKLTEIL